MHVNSVRAGYLDLDGCTVVDMLPRYVFRCSWQFLALTISATSSRLAPNAQPRILCRELFLSEENHLWQYAGSVIEE